MMTWKYFIGACVLAAGLLLPYAPLPAILAGVALAAVLNWMKHRGGVRA
jgi:hypothetical protein